MSRKGLFIFLILLVTLAVGLLLTNGKAPKKGDSPNETSVSTSDSRGNEGVAFPAKPSPVPGNEYTNKPGPTVANDAGTVASTGEPPENEEVRRFKITAEEFERDAATFRKDYPVYEEFLDIMHDTLAPWLIESKKANLAIRDAFGLKTDPERGSLTEDLRELRLEVHNKYGGEFWETMLYSMRGNLLADSISRLSDVARSGAIFVDEKDRKGLAQLAKTYSRQKEEGIKTEWPPIEKLFPGPNSLHYKFFSANRGDLVLTPLFVKVAGALPVELEERRKKIEETRLSLQEKGLMEATSTGEYVDAYRRALQDELRRIPDITGLLRQAETHMTSTENINAVPNMRGPEDE